ncbi:MAG: PAS domain S-box protein [Desulfobacterota bacterium]|nr:PAS domain S-box protein [Thermodesulfobacteriota bacterium]
MLYRILDRGVGALAILPVIVVAWCYGSKAGILTAFLSFPFNVIFLNILGDEGINTFIARAGGVAGTFALILIGWVVGRLSELSIQVKQELAERKKAEEKLRQITQTLMALVKESPLGIIVLDTSGKVSLWNPAANNTLGWNAAETTGKIFPSFDTHSREELWHKIRTVLDGTPIKNIELQHKHSNGRLVNIALSAVPLHDEAGVVNGILILMEDITEEKRLQQEILFVSGREQRRIGQDLHDGLGQVLTGIGFLTRSLEKRLRSKSLPEAEDAATIGRLVNEAVEQTRNLSRGLYPATLENEGFKAAIEELASSVGSRFSVQCKFICNSDHDIHDPFLSIHLYRIVQEATTNAVRHGEPRRIIISLDVEDTRGILTVRDDGKGFAIAEHGGGMGINLMRYRAKMIGADFTLQSSPGQGTVVICSFTFPHQTNTPLNHLEKEQQHGKTTP